jgi:hypothetical protein
MKQEKQMDGFGAVGEIWEQEDISTLITPNVT